ncbi:MAG: AraC family transcriptional regulator, partial [Cyclobacteriaceae bacterium]
GNKLEERVIELINKDVVDYLHRNKKFSSKKLSLDQIAKDIQVSPHHLTQAVNLGLKMNITDLINKYRVDEVKERLVDPKFTHYSIVSIGLDAGFSTKASFYNAFKKHVGMTPTVYVKTLHSEQGE